MIEAGSSTKTLETTCQNSHCRNPEDQKLNPFSQCRGKFNMKLHLTVMQTVTHNPQNLPVDLKKNIFSRNFKSPQGLMNGFQGFGRACCVYNRGPSNTGSSVTAYQSPLIVL
jgi:hypothetical protein